MAPVKLVVFYASSLVTANHDHPVFIELPGKGEHSVMIITC